MASRTRTCADAYCHHLCLSRCCVLCPFPGDEIGYAYSEGLGSRLTLSPRLQLRLGWLRWSEYEPRNIIHCVGVNCEMIPCVSTPSGCKENSRGFSEIVFLSPGEHRHNATDICLHFRSFTFADFFGFSCLSCEVQHSLFSSPSTLATFRADINCVSAPGVHLAISSRQAHTVLMSIRLAPIHCDAAWAAVRHGITAAFAFETLRAAVEGVEEGVSGLSANFSSTWVGGSYVSARCRCAGVFFQPMLHLVPALRKVFCIQRFSWCKDTRSCDSPRRLFRISRISYVKMYSGRLSWTLFSLVASRAVTDRLLFRLRSTCLICRWALLRSLRLQCKCRV